jgi:hypothetical protein
MDQSNEWNATVLRDIDGICAEIAGHAQRRGLPWRHVFHTGYMEVYVRVTQHYLCPSRSKRGAVYQTIDLASVNVLEARQRQGIFTTLLERLQSIAFASGRALYVENVINEHLVQHFRKLPGITKLRLDGGYSPPCYAFIPPQPASGAGAGGNPLPQYLMGDNSAKS